MSLQFKQLEWPVTEIEHTQKLEESLTRAYIQYSRLI